MDDGYKRDDISGPEFAYLGHFRNPEWLCLGHNELDMEAQIEQGHVPNIHGGGQNLPADAEPSQIANSGQAPDESKAGQSGSQGGMGSSMGSGGGTGPGTGPASQALKSAFGIGGSGPLTIGGLLGL